MLVFLSLSASFPISDFSIFWWSSLRKYQLWVSQNFQDSAKLVLLCVQNPWLEFVDFEQAQYEISCTAATWRSVVSGRPQMEAPLHRRRRLSEQSGKC